MMWRIFELLLLFFGIPAVLLFIDVPIIPVLLLVTIVCLIYLTKSRAFTNNKLYKLSFPKYYTKKVLLRFIIVAILLVPFTYVIGPYGLFPILKTNPLLWVAIMLLYPLFSVIPQGIVYRAFFYHRYAQLFPQNIRALLSAILFSYVHILFGNSIAVIFTFIGGYWFAKTYEHTNSLPLSILEHALYGCLMFTIGLGTFFYSGA